MLGMVQLHDKYMTLTHLTRLSSRPIKCQHGGGRGSIKSRLHAGLTLLSVAALVTSASKTDSPAEKTLMGAKESKETTVATGATAFYKSTLKQAILDDIAQTILNTHNVELVPWSSDSAGQVLVIKDGTNDDMSKLKEESQNLGPNHLLVVLVPRIEKQDSDVSTLVQLKWEPGKSLEFSGANQSSTRTILDFIEMDSATPPPPTEVPRKKPIPVAFDRDHPDSSLQNAVRFVESTCDIELHQTDNIQESPLLVFCKNDTRLGEDLDQALRRTRAGKDVMLLVITDKADLQLSHTNAAKGLGATCRLYWDHSRKKFGGRDNHEAMVWVRNFLEPFGFEVNVKLNRTESFRRSMKSLSSSKFSGPYFAFPSIPEDQLRATIAYFDQELIDLKKADDPLTTSCLVLLCHPVEQTETTITEFLREKDPRDVLVVYLCKVFHKPAQLSRPNSVQLRISDTAPHEILDKAENVKVVEKVRNFLARKTRPKKGEDQLPAELKGSNNESGQAAAESDAENDGENT